jgi:hypothetical protein
MEQFLTTTSCRRYLLLSYFDAGARHPDEPRQQCCDNCTRHFLKSTLAAATSGAGGSALNQSYGQLIEDTKVC